jgi:DNA topoisomerase-1
VEREREIQKFAEESAFKVMGTFIGEANKPFEAELDTTIKQAEDVETLLKRLLGAEYAIKSIEVKPGKKSPSSPFTTSTLQQEASRKLGFPVAKTMQVAQKLYEAGHITYMRTDSVNLSDFAVKAAQNEIVKEYGKEYSNPTYYKTKTKGSQEAHECIRPTHFEQRFAGNESSEKKLYNLIRQRTVASQMAPAELEKTKAIIDIFPTDTSKDKSNDKKHHFIATGEVIKFDGFLKLYFESTDNEDDDELSKGMLPKLTEGEPLINEMITATEKFKNHPPRYTEASLVKELESQGIGRPSTYAPTISTIQKRNYVVKEDRPGKERTYKEYLLKKGNITVSKLKQMTGAEKQKLFPTDIGMVVNDFLTKHFPKIMDYGFTANVEEEFDIVAEGKLKRNEMISQFYIPFHQLITDTGEVERVNSERPL